MGICDKHTLLPIAFMIVKRYFRNSFAFAAYGILEKYQFQFKFYDTQKR